MSYSVNLAEILRNFPASSACGVRCEDFSWSMRHSLRDWQHCLPQFVALVASLVFKSFLCLFEFALNSPSYSMPFMSWICVLKGLFNVLNVNCINVACFLDNGKITYKSQYCDSRMWTGHGRFLPDVYFQRFIIGFVYCYLWNFIKISGIFKLKGNVLYKNTSHTNVLYLRSSIFITAVYFKHFNRQQ